MDLLRRLNETPIPDDWDRSKFDSSTSFAQRIKYCQEQAQKLGSGSSRVAFIIEYQGRKTVLKVAKNKKGIAQNGVEYDALSDWFLKRLEIFIPMIDADEENDPPTWIHTEFAEKMTNAKFKKFFGVSPFELVKIAEKRFGYKNARYFTPDESKLKEDDDCVINFMDYVGNYQPMIGDYSRIANWGIYQDKPVIIDIGLDQETYYTYYKPKSQNVARMW